MGGQRDYLRRRSVAGHSGGGLGATQVHLPVIGREVSLDRLYIAVSLIVLNVVDVLLTKGVLIRGGIEGNPLMKDLMAGFAAPLGLKAAVAGIAAILLLNCPNESGLADRAAATVAGIYLAVVAWNAAVLGILHFQF